jgi:peptidoglycan/LPS O-acetylase OafA/YrhL
LFLLIFVLIEFAKLIFQNHFGLISPNSTPFKENNWTAMFQQFFLIQSIGPTGNARTFNGPAWSISVEFYTYFIFSFIQLIAARFKSILIFVLFLVSFFLFLIKFPAGFDELLSCITGFLLGCLTAILTRHVKFKVKPGAIMISAGLIFIFLAFWTDHRQWALIYFLSSFLILTIVLSENGLMRRILNLKLLTWLGAISYSIYMSHAFVIWVVNQVLRVALKRQEVIVSGASTPQLSITEAFFACVVTVLLVLIVSNFTYIFIEKPFRERSRRFVSGIGVQG